MKFKPYYLFVIPVLGFIFVSCSTTQKTTGTQLSDTTGVSPKDTVFVFDKVPPQVPAKQDRETTPENNDQSNLEVTYYVVQIGAFSTKERAEEFAAESRKKISNKVIVSFDPLLNLYVVQLSTHYNSHKDAEDVRNELWKNGEFKDAWIVSGQK